MGDFDDEYDFEGAEPNYGDDVSLGFDDDERASRSLNGDPVIDDDESLDGSIYDDDDTLDGYSFDEDNELEDEHGEY